MAARGKFKVHQTTEILHDIKEMADIGGAHICYAGPLDGGRKVVCVARLIGEFELPSLPKDLKAAEDPFGGQTAWKLFQLIKGCTLVAAWGMDGKYRGRAPEILEAAKVLGIDVWCFGKNKDGSPLHPCYARLPDELIRYDL